MDRKCLDHGGFIPQKVHKENPLDPDLSSRAGGIDLKWRWDPKHFRIIIDFWKGGTAGEKKNQTGTRGFVFFPFTKRVFGVPLTHQHFFLLIGGVYLVGVKKKTVAPLREEENRFWWSPSIDSRDQKKLKRKDLYWLVGAFVWFVAISILFSEAQFPNWQLLLSIVWKVWNHQERP